MLPISFFCCIPIHIICKSWEVSLPTTSSALLICARIISRQLLKKINSTIQNWYVHQSQSCIYGVSEKPQWYPLAETSAQPQTNRNLYDSTNKIVVAATSVVENTYNRYFLKFGVYGVSLDIIKVIVAICELLEGKANNIGAFNKNNNINNYMCQIIEGYPALGLGSPAASTMAATCARNTDL